MFKAFVASGLLALLLSGCSTSADKLVLKPSYEHACCEKIESVSFMGLPLQQPVDVEIDSTAPTLDIGAGPEHFAAFQLPDIPNLKIRFRSWFNTSFVGPHFDPVAVFLNENREAILTDSLDLRYRRYNTVAFGPGKLNSHMLGALNVPSEARYLILATMPSNIDTILNLKTVSKRQLRISNPQIDTRLSNGYQKLVPKPVGLFELTVIDPLEIASQN